MKHLFIINPAAGKYDHTKDYSTVIDRICKKHGLEYEIFLSTAPGMCREAARKAAESGEEIRIYACGGDGTLNEVINGAAGFDNVAVTHFPGGTGNDAIKIFSETEPFHHLERLLDCEEAKLDLICCNGRYSMNIVSMGLDARINNETQAYKRLPLLGGKNAYTSAMLVNLFKGLSQHFVVRIDDGEPIDAKQTLICVCNGRWYGGVYNPMPDAEPNDGMLDVIIVKQVNLLQISKLIAIYKRGGYAEIPEFIEHHRCKSITIDCDKESVINADGEIYHAMQAKMEVVPAALRFFYPKRLTYAAKEFTYST
ncbi:MAG: diacylglycerol kinase family lipid kinase [Oscillospiraceae bacterium]|nr:diacylglycerol kinase family lipid kinase [Oscillospiraceae bacterium]